MIRRVFYFVFLFPLFLWSQIPSQDIKNMGIYQDSIYVFTSNSVYVSPIDVISFVERPIYADPEVYNGVIKVNVLSSGIYITMPLAGFVLKFQNDSLVRIDRSFKHRMQINASELVHDNNIVRYGGYGFWSNRNFFTKFDKVPREWEPIAPLNTEEIPEGTKENYYAYNGNQIILFGGEQLDPIDMTTDIKSDQVWEFDFKELRWTNLGQLQFDVHSMSDILYMHYQDKFILQDDPFLYVFDPFNNKVLQYRQNSVHKKMMGFGVCQFYKGKFYLLLSANNQGLHYLEVRSEDEFFGPLEAEYTFYKKNHWPWLFLGLPILIFGFVGYKLYRRWKAKTNSVSLKADGLIYKRIFYRLDPIQVGILKCLLAADSGVETSELMKLIENPDHNYSHNMRTKNLVISELNYKLRTVFKIEHDLIQSHKSGRDKRIIIYTMDKSYFKGAVK
ncbi:MAG: hypothetical protein RLZZ463_1502 [Bacteroidota bacterium]